MKSAVQVQIGEVESCETAFQRQSHSAVQTLIVRRQGRPQTGQRLPAKWAGIVSKCQLFSASLSLHPTAQ